jgi:hypothetical protein
VGSDFKREADDLIVIGLHAEAQALLEAALDEIWTEIRKNEEREPQ